MERCIIMREEKVTINIIKWLESNGWEIICYDYPQSGTGIMIHPDSSVNENIKKKNEGAIIPDIIAVRNSISVFFENKDRFVLSDFDKIIKIKQSGLYNEGLNSLLKGYNIQHIYYGIGLPDTNKDILKSMKNLDDIDFLISTNENGDVYIKYEIVKIFD